jgi:hypothetical protein
MDLQSMVFHRDLRLGLMIVRAATTGTCTEATDRLDADDVQSAFRDAENTNGAAIMCITGANKRLLVQKDTFLSATLILAHRTPSPASSVSNRQQCKMLPQLFWLSTDFSALATIFIDRHHLRWCAAKFAE